MKRSEISDEDWKKFEEWFCKEKGFQDCWDAGCDNAMEDDVDGEVSCCIDHWLFGNGICPLYDEWMGSRKSD